MDSVSTLNKAPLLNVEQLSVTFGGLKAVHNIDFQINTGDLYGLIGPNGAGKTTVFNAITNTVPIKSGTIRFGENNINGLKPHQVAELGIVRVFQAATIFPQIPVLVHVMNGLHCRTSTTFWGALLRTSFSKKEDVGGQLSGGERQMLAIGRAIMSRPTLYLFDEPTLGLSPIVIEEISGIIKEISDQGGTILLVEQNALMALELARRGYVLKIGRITHQGPSQELLQDEQVKKAYLGM